MTGYCCRILLLCAVFSVVDCNHAANCALRDRDRQNFELFPEATRYITVEGFVDVAVMRTIEKQIGHKLSFSEAGKTTMCILYNEEIPLGFVHARSELGTRGTVELVWAMDIDMRVRGFSVQRSREPNSKVLRRSEFKEMLIGKDWKQLNELLGDAAGSKVDLSLGLKKLAYGCGIKTILILENGFQTSVNNSRLVAYTYREFPDTHTLSNVPVPLDKNVIRQAQRRLGRSALEIPSNLTAVLRSRNVNGTGSGWIVHARIDRDGTREEVVWFVASDHAVKTTAVLSPGRTFPADEWDVIEGKTLSELSERPTQTEPVGLTLEVLALISALDT